MDYILIAYTDSHLKQYFIDSRADLNDYIVSKGKNVLNNISIDCDAHTFITNCRSLGQRQINLIFYSHGNENAIVDSLKNAFISSNMDLSTLNIKTFYSTACKTAKSNLKEKVLQNSNIFFGYNTIAYAIIGGEKEKNFISCDNYCIKKIISGLTEKRELLNATDKFFKDNISGLIQDNFIVEAAFLMHNKEAIEIH